jgi:multidrug resistance efflux pump
MRNNLIVDLAECSEFRQTLQARPPRIVHGTALLLSMLLGAALVWSAVTQADLVVRAPCLVRPVTSPLDSSAGVIGEKVSVARTGRVVEVNFQVGSRVKQGDVLIRLDTERIANDIKVRQRTITAGKTDLVELDKQEKFLGQKYQVDRARAEQELDQAREEVRQAKERQEAEIAQAEAELAQTQHEEAVLRKLVPKGAASASELVKASAQARVARANLQKAMVVLDDSKVRIAAAALDQLAKDHDLRHSELEIKREAKKRELDTTAAELANLELERKETVLYAPTDGVVTSGEVRVGDTLEAGRAALAIAQEQGFRVDVAVPSAEIGHLREGMVARIKLDAYDYQRYGTVTGTVYQISPDSQRPEGQPTVSYTVKIKLQGDEVGQGDHHGRVKLGMSGTAEIVTGQESIFSLLVRKVRQTISLG